MNVRRLGMDNNWFLIQTNSDNWRQQPEFDDRYISAKKCMQTQGQSRVDFESIYNVLVSRPMLNKVSIDHSFETNLLLMSMK